eukprot:TRINITY_DN2947_c0_g1_i1.p1 TRINITY_DN2947_c0_g1~~TRINITY_DN2947_c0_g1_i1.p1  ORF type:complete len:3469 (+),score=661.06 TRINITY_DN2947_c0_g1_i1:555-10409(+)
MDISNHTISFVNYAKSRIDRYMINCTSCEHYERFEQVVGEVYCVPKTQYALPCVEMNTYYNASSYMCVPCVHVDVILDKCIMSIPLGYYYVDGVGIKICPIGFACPGNNEPIIKCQIGEILNSNGSLCMNSSLAFENYVEEGHCIGGFSHKYAEIEDPYAYFNGQGTVEKLHVVSNTNLTLIVLRITDCVQDAEYCGLYWVVYGRNDTIPVWSLEISGDSDSLVNVTMSDDYIFAAFNKSDFRIYKIADLSFSLIISFVPTPAEVYTTMYEDTYRLISTDGNFFIINNLVYYLIADTYFSAVKELKVTAVDWSLSDVVVKNGIVFLSRTYKDGDNLLHELDMYDLNSYFTVTYFIGISKVIEHSFDNFLLEDSFERAIGLDYDSNTGLVAYGTRDNIYVYSFNNFTYEYSLLIAFKDNLMEAIDRSIKIRNESLIVSSVGYNSSGHYVASVQLFFDSSKRTDGSGTFQLQFIDVFDTTTSYLSVAISDDVVRVVSNKHTKILTYIMECQNCDSPLMINANYYSMWSYDSLYDYCKMSSRYFLPCSNGTFYNASSYACETCYDQGIQCINGGRVFECPFNEWSLDAINCIEAICPNGSRFDNDLKDCVECSNPHQICVSGTVIECGIDEITNNYIDCVSCGWNSLYNSFLQACEYAYAPVGQYYIGNTSYGGVATCLPNHSCAGGINSPVECLKGEIVDFAGGSCISLEFEGLTGEEFCENGYFPSQPYDPLKNCSCYFGMFRGFNLMNVNGTYKNLTEINNDGSSYFFNVAFNKNSTIYHNPNDNESYISLLGLNQKIPLFREPIASEKFVMLSASNRYAFAFYFKESSLKLDVFRIDYFDKKFVSQTFKTTPSLNMYSSIELGDDLLYVDGVFYVATETDVLEKVAVINNFCSALDLVSVGFNENYVIIGCASELVNERERGVVKIIDWTIEWKVVKTLTNINVTFPDSSYISSVKMNLNFGVSVDLDIQMKIVAIASYHFTYVYSFDSIDGSYELMRVKEHIVFTQKFGESTCNRIVKIANQTILSGFWLKYTDDKYLGDGGFELFAEINLKWVNVFDIMKSNVWYNVLRLSSDGRAFMGTIQTDDTVNVKPVMVGDTCSNKCFGELIYNATSNQCVIDPNLVTCDPGYYSDFDRCIRCIGPVYCVDNIQLPCPNGTTPSIDRTTCVACPTDKYCVENSFPKQCPYNTIPSPSTNASECVKCGSGYHGDGMKCVECSYPYVCPNGIQEKCPFGKKPLNSSHCTACVLPEQCPDGIVKYCLPGKYAVSNTLCDYCPVLHMCLGGNNMPIECNYNQIVATNNQSCLDCGSDSYCVDGVSTRCDPGQMPDETHSKCVPCTSTMVCPHGIAKSCSDGTLPNAGNTFCEPCTLGMVCSEGISKYCDDGFMPNADQTACIACEEKMICLSGSVYSCPSRFTPNELQTACVDCSLDKVCPNGYEETCSPGMMPDKSSTECVPCEEGYICEYGYADVCPTAFQPSVDKLSCVTCEDGYICPQGDKVSCDAGEYAYLSSVCKPCPAENYCENGLIKTCEPGLQPNSVNTGCETCEIGYSCPNGSKIQCSTGTMPDTSQTLCIDCAEGKACPSGVPITCPGGYAPSSNHSLCISCPSGFVCPSGVKEVCGNGYRPAEDRINCEEITMNCPDGQIPDTTFSSCISCPLNRICSGNVAYLCDSGKQPNVLQTECVECDFNHVCPYGFSTYCSPGMYDLEDNINCDPCLSNKVCPNGYIETCVDGFMPDDYNLACINCTVGHICIDGVASRCSGTTVPNSLRTECLECPNNNICQNGISKECSTNMVPNDELDTCVPCGDCVFRFNPVVLPRALNNRTIEIVLLKNVTITQDVILTIPKFNLQLISSSNYSNTFVFELPDEFNPLLVDEYETISARFEYNGDSYLSPEEEIQIYSEPILLSVEPSSLPRTSAKNLTVQGINIRAFGNPIKVKLQSVLQDKEIITFGVVKGDSIEIVHVPLPFASLTYDVIQILPALNNHDFAMNGISYTSYEMPVIRSLSPSNVVSYGGEIVELNVSSIFRSSSAIVGLYFINDNDEFELFSTALTSIIDENTVKIVTPTMSASHKWYYPALSLNGDDFNPSNNIFLTIDDSSYISIVDISSLVILHPCVATSSAKITFKLSSDVEEQAYGNFTYYNDVGSVVNEVKEVKIWKGDDGVYELVFDQNNCSSSEIQLTVSHLKFNMFFKVQSSVIPTQTISFFSSPPTFDNIYPSTVEQIGNFQVLIGGQNFSIANFQSLVKIGSYLVEDYLVRNNTAIMFSTPPIPEPISLEVFVAIDGFTFKTTNLFLHVEGCSKGYYSSSYLEACRPCSEGTAIDVENAVSCKSCAPGYYADEKGLTNCKTCPEHAISPKGASNVSECYCEAGYFGQYGQKCHKCPPGATCPKGSIYPIPNKGYWSSKNDPTVVVECIPANACSGGNLSASATADDIFGSCDNGFSGERCSECGAGHYVTSSDMCIQCPDLGLLSVIFVIVGAIILCIIMICITRPPEKYQNLVNNSPSNLVRDESEDDTELNLKTKKLTSQPSTTSISSESSEHNMENIPRTLTNLVGALKQNATTLTIGINFAQVTAILKNFDLAWPDSILKVFSWFSTLNFNLSVASPGCLFTMNFIQDVYSRLALPILFLIIFVGIYFIGKKFLAVGKSITWKYNIIASFALLMVYLYSFLGQAGLDFFNCTTLADGTRVLVKSPDIICNSSEWSGHMFVPMLGIIIYVFGIPITYFVIVRHFAKDKRLDEMAIKVSLGKLYENYVGIYAFWESFIMLRKLLVLLCIVFLATSETDKALLSVCLLFVALLAQVFFAPFKSAKFDVMEFSSLLASLLVLFSGIVSDHADVTSGVKTIMNLIAVLGVLFVVVIFITILISNIQPLKWFEKLFPVDEVDRKGIFEKDDTEVDIGEVPEEHKESDPVEENIQDKELIIDEETVDTDLKIKSEEEMNQIISNSIVSNHASSNSSLLNDENPDGEPSFKAITPIFSDNESDSEESDIENIEIGTPNIGNAIITDTVDDENVQTKEDLLLDDLGKLFNKDTEMQIGNNKVSDSDSDDILDGLDFNNMHNSGKNLLMSERKSQNSQNSLLFDSESNSIDFNESDLEELSLENKSHEKHERNRNKLNTLRRNKRKNTNQNQSQKHPQPSKSGNDMLPQIGFKKIDYHDDVFANEQPELLNRNNRSPSYASDIGKLLNEMHLPTLSTTQIENNKDVTTVTHNKWHLSSDDDVPEVVPMAITNFTKAVNWEDDAAKKKVKKPKKKSKIDKKSDNFYGNSFDFDNLNLNKWR